MYIYLGPKQVELFQHFVVRMIPVFIGHELEENDNSNLLAEQFQWNTGIVLQVNCCYRFSLICHENRETLESFWQQNIGITQLALAQYMTIQ